MENIVEHRDTGFIPVGRFAPSPTGPLHTGSLVAAVGSWLMAKQNGGRWLLRIDDLDTARCRKEFEDDILLTLELFGLLWDGTAGRQSENTEAYEDAFATLQKTGEIYPCSCTRADIARASSAPHSGEEIPYPGTCRNGMSKPGEARSWRLKTCGRTVSFDDARHGTVTADPGESGDFIVKRADGLFAYQLAVVVDDQLSGVDQVTRGDDLLDSTPRQVLIHQLLGWPVPAYCHLPLVTATDGTKLSKRDNTVSILDGRIKGDESRLLGWSLEFLGIKQNDEIKKAPCPELLNWALSQFSSELLPRPVIQKR